MLAPCALATYDVNVELRADVKRVDAEGVMVAIRWVAIVFAAVQVATFYLPYPAGYRAAAWTVIATITACSIVITVAWMRERGTEQAYEGRGWVGAFALAADTAFAIALIWVFSFDVYTAIFVVGYVAVVEGAYRYGIRGSLITMGVVGVSYALRDAWASDRFEFGFYWTSISFRVGVGFLIACVAGWMAERARREHARLLLALRAEQEAAAALRSLDELRSTFLAAVSHELRTPLTSILGFSVTIRDFSPGLAPEARVMLDHVVEESHRLERLLEDLLDIERMGRGSVSIERARVDVAELARACAHRAAEATGRSLVVDQEHAIGIVDAGKVERVIDNLVGNALKYSPASSTVEIHLERVDDGILLRVDDEGPGVPIQYRGTIFAPFERGALTSGHKPGTGIGLSLVDRFARLHGGRAWVEERHQGDRDGNRAGTGASFRVYLPDGPEGERVVTVAHHPWGEAAAQ